MRLFFSVTLAYLAMAVCGPTLVAVQIVSAQTVESQTAQSPTQSPTIDFARDIRPILSDACFKCHGPDASTREADLRLDTESGLLADLGGYVAVKRGDAAQSELVKRILSEDADDLMPPQEAHKPLSEKQKELLVRWIDEGAVWQQHWSFVAPADGPVPQITAAQVPAAQHALSDWCINDIDRFVLQQLTRVGLAPSRDADPHTLVRRLYLDLIGLPPTGQAADEWIAKIWPGQPHDGRIDESAYQALVTFLLESPQYGERWARRWLDLARYADTNGYEKDRDRSIWPYRDWVVQALNNDMPFDQFTIEQLAGDMLPNATTSQQIATGFHRNTMLNEEGGIDPLEFRFHAMTDRVATTGTTWLGLTLGCCQCHTHKYDPTTHTEYYQLMALLNNADEPILELPEALVEGDFEQIWRQNREQADRLLAELPQRWPIPNADNLKADSPKVNNIAESPDGKSESAKNAARQAAMNEAFAAWLSREQANAASWQALHPIQATANLPILTIQEDDSIFASGDTAKRDVYEITFSARERPITALRLEALPDERLPARGPGSTYYEGTLGDFYLVELVAKADTPVQLLAASHSYAKNRYGKNEVSAQLTLDQDVQTGWSVDGRQGERHVAVYLLQEPLQADKSLTITMTFGRHFASSLGRFRFSATDAPHPPQARDFPPDIERLLMIPDTALSVDEKDQLLKQFLLSAPELASYTEKIRKLQARPEVPTTLVMTERPDKHPRPTFRHHRGEYLQPQEQVAPGVPGVFAGLSEQAPTNRLALARWLVSANNPLTARVTVNRHWAAFFGRGIVATLDDFGLQGQSPSHPELLDWLALRFIGEDRWSIKKLHRRIVSSRTYRQSSEVNLAAKDVDPENRLLSYAPRYRLDAEVLRDNLLVISGLINLQMGGPPVRPLQAAGISEFAYGAPKWAASSGAERYRRSLYTFVKRTAPFAMYSTFDAPSGEACIAQRTRSNSPLQALTLLNDVMVLELARATGKRMAESTASESLTAELAQLFRSALVRPATAAELELLHKFYDSQLKNFLSAPEQALELVDGSSKVDSSSQPHPPQLARTAAWIATARAIFALDETQTRN